METVAKVRRAKQPNDWAFSLDLTDAYLHPQGIAEIPQVLSLESSLSAPSINFRPGHKSVRFYSIDGCHSITREEIINNPVSIPGS